MPELPELLPMGDARSRIPFSEYRSAKRLDPFYDYLWKRADSAVAWRSFREMRARSSAGLRRSASWFQPSDSDVEYMNGRLLTGRRELKLSTLGAVFGWRTATVEQVQAITGYQQLTTGKGSALRSLYAANLIDVGSSGGFNGWAVNNDEVRSWLVHPSRTSAFEREVAPRLTAPELISITGGREWVTGGQYDRHNILATEFALRAAEFTRSKMVLGEQWSSASQLLWEGWGDVSPFASGPGGSKAGRYENRGDLTIVREDGLRIVVEVTASTSGKSFVQKVWKWLYQMRQAPLSAQGTVVLFLVVGEQTPRGGEVQRLRREVQRGIQEAILQEPGYGENLSADRVFVANWADLFPARHSITPDFDRLPVLAPWGLKEMRPVADRIWQRTYLLDPQQVPYTPDPRRDPLAVTYGAAALHQTPHWLRGEKPQFASDAAKFAWPDGLPGLRREDLQGRGAVRPPGYPERVLV